jgi:hypothetical protein
MINTVIFVIGFVIGSFVGGAVGVGVMCCMTAAKQADEDMNIG